MFQYEARFGRISDPRRCWAPKPIRPMCKAMCVREYTYAYTAVEVATGKMDSLVLPYANTACMQLFLGQVGNRHSQENIIMVVDGAGWHTGEALKPPGNIRLLVLPPYAPELNPVEHIWDELREKFFHNHVFKSLSAVEKQLVTALKAYEQNPETIKSIVAWNWIINALLIWKLNKFLVHRIADKPILRLIRKWPKAGVIEDGRRVASEQGCPQGAVISPLLSNIYLHYVLDTWAHRWRKQRTQGNVIIVRYADDNVLGFQYESMARRFLAALRERMAKFGLVLHPDKTRLIEFGKYAVTNRLEWGLGKPETFDFLGFTHVCTRNKLGYFQFVRLTIKSACASRSHLFGKR